MLKPDSRRIGRPAGKPATKTTRSVPKTARRAAAPEEAEERRAAAMAASEESKAKNQMALIGGIGGGGLLLIIIIVAAASSGSSNSAAEAQRRSKKAPAPAPVEAPPPKAKPTNYVRNTGAIVFVCAGTEKHPDKEIVLPQCPKCPAKNAFEVDGDARAYRCTKCKGIYENADIKCGDCDRTARVTHLKKAALGQ